MWVSCTKIKEINVLGWFLRLRKFIIMNLKMKNNLIKNIIIFDLLE